MTDESNEKCSEKAHSWHDDEIESRKRDMEDAKAKIDVTRQEVERLLKNVKGNCYRKLITLYMISVDYRCSGLLLRMRLSVPSAGVILRSQFTTLRMTWMNNTEDAEAYSSAYV